MWGCHDDFVAEGLLTRLGVIMSSEFEGAKLLGRLGRGHLPETRCLKHALRRREEEASFSWSGGTWYVDKLAQLHGHTGDRAVTKTKTPGTKATGSGARDAGTAPRVHDTKTDAGRHAGAQGLDEKAAGEQAVDFRIFGISRFQKHL